ncbi:MAG: TrmH family RNA methyltransferase [Candidatus Nanopelagicales bacterium]
MAELTLRSARVVAARKLRRRRVREQLGELLAEGPAAVAEACAAGAALEVFYSKPELWSALGPERLPNLPAYLVAPIVIESLCDSETPQGIVARCRWSAAAPEVLRGPVRLGLLAHEVREPGNSGAIMRVADAVAADFLAFGAGSVDPTNAKAVRASAGSLFHLPIVTGVDPLATLSDLRAAGVRTLAADISPAAVDLFDLQGLAQPTVWLFGNEAHGLPEVLRRACDEVVRIPIFGQAESLNLATATAVCMYASALAQRRPPPA